MSGLIKMCKDMTVSLFARKAVVSWGLMLATSCLVQAQGNYTKLATEHLLGGSAPGAQIHAQASLSTQGGYAVWEDPAADGEGPGIMAAGLDSHFGVKGTPFRVNQFRAGPQEKPQVSLLDSGEVVFAWQGGPLNKQHIYARVLNSAHAWAGGDLLISSADHISANVSLASLNNGQVVAVYSSFNQRGLNSMGDIYARFINPAVVAGVQDSEIAVNGVMTFGQRTPAVAALKGNNGGFVVVWVSENQRFDSSVDIYGRMFDASGSPVTGEFLVNASTNACANPSVAASTDGSFMVGWSEFSGNRRTGWEVKVRSFDASGNGGAEVQANTYVNRNQVGPRVAALAGRYMVVWTSMGQDRFNEAIVGRYFDNAGSALGNEFLVNTTAMSRQVFPTVAADGANRFLVIWSSFLGGVRNNFDLYAQKFAPQGFAEEVLVADKFGPPAGGDAYPLDQPPGTPDQTGNTWENWLAGLPRLMAPAAAGAPSPTSGYDSAAGNYYGLFYDAEGVRLENSGYVSAQVSRSQAFSARLVLGRSVYPISGKFDQEGKATVTKRVGVSQMEVQLALDLAGGEQLRGKVLVNGMTADLIADKLVHNSRTAKAPQAGIYTFTFRSPSASVGVSPLGDGIAAVKVDHAGIVTLSGKMADGTAISQKTAISRNGTWPLYVPLFGGKGMVLSWIRFAEDEDADAAGQIIWLKKAGASVSTYRNGFTNELAGAGVRYTPPAARQMILPMSGGQLVLSGAGLGSSVTNSFTLTTSNTVRPGTPGLAVSISPSTGTFRGSARNPSTGRPVTFQGVLNRQGGVGSGFFLQNNQSGHVFLGPLE